VEVISRSRNTDGSLGGLKRASSSTASTPVRFSWTLRTTRCIHRCTRSMPIGADSETSKTRTLALMTACCCWRWKEYPALHRPMTPLVVVQQDAFLAEFLFQNVVLGPEVFDDFLLMTVHPTGQNHVEQLPGLQSTHGEGSAPGNTRQTRLVPRSRWNRWSAT
jgi:hypothetical protein